MALIEKAKGRRENQSPGGYTRLFGLERLGNLMSRIQGAVISSGSELERLIWERVNQVDDLDTFLDRTIHGGEDKIFVAIKKQIKLSTKIHSKYEPDFIGFNPHRRICYIVEVKDGDQFDTKKSSGEHATLHSFRDDISSELPYSTSIFICSFNAATKEEIFKGLKGKFALTEIITGKELCDLFGINYGEIRRIRMNDQRRNLEYFIKEILKIGAVRAIIVKLMNNPKD